MIDLYESRARAMYAERVGKMAADAVRRGEKYRVVPWSRTDSAVRRFYLNKAEAEHMAEVMANRRPGPNRGVRRGDPGVIGQRILADGRTVVTDYGGGHTETYRWPYPVTMASLGWSASRSTGPAIHFEAGTTSKHDMGSAIHRPFVSVAELRQELADAHEAARMLKLGQESLRAELAEMTRWRDNVLEQRDDAREHLRDARETIGKLSLERDELRRGVMRGQNVVTMEAHRYALAFAERERDAARNQRAEAVRELNRAQQERADALAQRDRAELRHNALIGERDRLRGELAAAREGHKTDSDVRELSEKLAEAERGWESAGRENQTTRVRLRDLRAELEETRAIAAKAQREREEARDKHVECYRQLTHTRELLAEAVATASRPLPACKGHNDAEYKRGLAAARAVVQKVQAGAITERGDYAQGRAMGLRLVLNHLEELGANHV